MTIDQCLRRAATALDILIDHNIEACRAEMLAAGADRDELDQWIARHRVELAAWKRREMIRLKAELERQYSSHTLH